MKQNYLKLRSGLFCLLAGMPIAAFSQVVTYSFNSCGATGQVGPTQSQANTAYSATNLNGLVTVNGGIQSWVVPATGDYRIVAAGASGGGTGTSFGCRGRIVEGDVNLTQGTVLQILVGQKGTEDNQGQYQSSGGGGGSFIVANNTPILVAGGGGGHLEPLTSAVPSSDAVYTQSGNNSLCNSGAGGSGGNGGNGSNDGWGGGGGGFSTDGTDGAYCSSTGGSSFLNGGMGAGTCWNAYGGFGGGGGSHGNTGGGGGGGGYSGGGGSNQNQYPNAGGGGGSYQAPGMFNLADGGLHTGDGWVTITKLCSVSLAASANPICQGDNVVLSTDAVSNISWSSGGSASSTTVSPSVTTTYSVTGTSTANCITTAVITISVNPLPVLSAVSLPTMVCAGGTASLMAFGADTYLWSSSGTGSMTTVNPPSSGGTYTVTGTSAVGCNNTTTVSVTMNTNSLTMSPSATVCAGKQTTISASGAQSYQWNNGANFPSFPVSPSASTVYVVTAIDNFNCLLTGSVAVAVSQNPNITISQSKQVVCKGESITLTGNGGSTYVWNTGATTNAITENFAVDVPYEFIVTGTNADGCSNTATLTITVSKCTGVNEAGTVSGISVFPNPNSGLFTVETGKNVNGASVKVYNALGSLVKTQAIPATGNAEIDLRSEANGIYVVYLVQNNQEVQVSKIVKE